MSTSYDLNSTPKTINQSKYIEPLMDFSTPMSTISNRCISNTTIINDKIICTHNNNNTNNETIIDQLLKKFNEHKINFHNTKNYLNLLDGHLHETTTILNQLKNFLEENSSLKTTTDQLETRLLQISIKREQLRTAINNFHQSPTINQTLDDITQQISPRTSNITITTEPMIYCTELINAVKLSINQRKNIIEHFYHEQNGIQHRTGDYYSKFKQRQEFLMRLMQKIIVQQTLNEKNIETININKPQFDNHREQLAEFNKLTEEYQALQHENLLLKHKAKENIQKLYNSINQVTE
ncbi:unnamed protein product [Rotaria sp. Silwood2]|nr:unnamed protein product [Rotaria sp. Silwood2]CAF2478955.1 unnamed protein product [Rotaria sp. Silwood2]CAF2863193.1 unnamed protein product [Rotaria sp. Silwood2]CAF3960062.1 unnamed protein product [Rotaria sp. Silwood2]CAF4069160.1 unnamed protein product [Rotaria sp. Silwood2]